MRVKQPPPNGTKSYAPAPTSVAEITMPWQYCLGYYHISKSPRLLPALTEEGR